MTNFKLNCSALIFLLMLTMQVSAQQEKPLSNHDVVQLVKLGLSAEVIIKKIADSPADFDLSVKGLTMLAQNRVPNEVIEAMQAKSSRQPDKPSVGNSPSGGARPATDGKGKRSSYPLPHEKGAYLWNGSELRLLHQNAVTSIGENFWRKITPFVKKKIELQLVGAYAKIYFENQQPTILVSGLGEIVPGVPAFRLLYIKTGGMLKDRRIVGKYEVGGFFGSIRMVDNEIECEIKKVAEGVYAITPVKPLKDGEYGLVQVPKLSELSARPSFALPVWDFGIYAEGHPLIKGGF